MPQSVLSRGRKFVARLTALAMVASIMVIGAIPASAAIDTSDSCPNPPSAGFTDIGSFDATTQNAINCLVDYGISNGTSATTFSPNGEVTRWQMALFLTRQAEVHGLTLGDGSDQGFTDIGGLPATTQVAINQLAQLEITQGTSATTFSPNDPVTRWQMALFLTRLADAAGVTLGDGSDQGFTDIAGLDAATQVAINQAKQAGIADGTSATTYNPAAATLRWQMALFLTRTLAVDGIVPTGTYFWVTKVDTANNQITYSDGAKTAVYSYTETGAKSLNGNSVTTAVFESNLGTYNNTLTASVSARQIDPATGDVKSGVNATAGLVGATNGTNTYAIVEPVTGVGIGFATYNQTWDTYVVGGTAASLAVFNANISVGDTVEAIGGDGTTSAKARSIALTNGTVSGTVKAINGTSTVTIGVLVVPYPDGSTGESIAIDGTASTVTGFTNAVTIGDSATYAMASGADSYTLTNAAPAPVTGTANGTFATGVSLRWDAGSGVATLTYVDTTSATFVVDGVVSTFAQFEAAISAGDTVVYTAPDDDTSTTERVALTNSVVTSMVILPSSVNTTTNVLNLEDAAGAGFLASAVDYTAGGPPGYSTDASPEYTLNGSAATLTQFESALGAVASSFVTGTLTISDAGAGAVTYHLTTS